MMCKTLPGSWMVLIASETVDPPHHQAGVAPNCAAHLLGYLPSYQWCPRHPRHPSPESFGPSSDRIDRLQDELVRRHAQAKLLVLGTINCHQPSLTCGLTIIKQLRCSWVIIHQLTIINSWPSFTSWLSFTPIAMQEGQRWTWNGGSSIVLQKNHRAAGQWRPTSTPRWLDTR